MSARVYQFREEQRKRAAAAERQAAADAAESTGLGLAINKLGAARAAEDGVKFTHAAYPSGAPGVRMSIQEMKRLIREARNDKDICGAAGDILKKRGIDGRDRHRWTAKIVGQAFLDEIRERTVYSPDPTGTEMIVSPAASLCLRPGLCIQKLDCIPEGTLLLRDDYELVPIEKLRPGDRIWGRDKWTRVEATAFKGRLSVDAIEMNNGSTMYLTRDHKVYVGRCKHGKGTNCPTCYAAMRTSAYDRIHVGDLQEGDVLLRPDKIDFGTGEADPDRMYVEGLALADGWVDKPTCFHIAGKDGFRKEAQKKEVQTICEKLGIPTNWHRRYITVKDAAWAERIAHMGHYARFKRPPTINLNERTAAALLRGMMADSTVSAPGTNASSARTYSTTSRTMAIQVRVLHKMFGESMSCKMMTPEQHGGAGKHPMWRLGQRGHGHKQEKAPWTLAVRSIERDAREAVCWDIQTEDHYVYLPEYDVTVSNCDDLTVLLCSLLLSCGFRAYIVKQSWGKEHQEHVLSAVEDENGDLLKADPSHKSLPVGQCVRCDDEEFYDPMDEKSSIGVSGSEIVTFGALPQERKMFDTQVHDGHLWEWNGLGASWNLVGPLTESRTHAIVGLGTSQSDVDEAIDTLDPTMAAINAGITGCAQIPAASSQAWQGIYTGWQGVKSEWNFDKEGSIAPGPVYGSGILSQIQTYNNYAITYQALLAQYCPTLAPPKPLPTIGPQPSPGSATGGDWTDQVKTVAKVIGFGVGGLVLLYGGYRVIQITANVAQKKVAAT